MNYTPFLKKLVPWIEFRLDSPGQKTLYLTFDDGPDPASTLKICEILGKYSCTASFFVVGQQAEKYPEIIEKLDQEGHRVCNHSFTHKKFYFPQQIQKDIICNQQLLQTIIKKKITNYRPPYGRIFPGLKKAALELELSTILWDVFVPDYRIGFSAEKIAKRVVKYSQNGSIILLHDRSKNVKETIKALPNFIKILKEDGYLFHSLPETF